MPRRRRWDRRLLPALLLIAALQVVAAHLPTLAAASDLVATSDGLEDLVARVDPAVVQIFATSLASISGAVAPGSDLLSRQRSTGSGVILDPSGYIVTNAHVIRGARRIQVRLASPDRGSSALKPRGEIVGAHLVGIDEETDLAVIKVRREGLASLELGDSDDLRPGELVFAFGSPLGLENSVSLGIVSATARQLRPEDPMIYIQTDAPINPGNSGGPLVDTEGKVVGINTLIFSQSGGSEGLGFAAPSNIVRTIYEQLRDGGRVRRGVIGVHAQTVTPGLARGLELSASQRVVLGDVYPNGPAAKAGLKPGDVIETLDGKAMENGRQFDVNIYGRAIGSKVRLGIRRGRNALQVEVEVIERPDDPSRFLELAHPEDNLVPRLGVLALTLDSRLRSMLPKLRYDAGVVVAASSGEASIWGDGFLPGDVIYAVNESRVTELEELQAAIDPLRRGDAFVVQVERFGQLMYLAFEVE